MGLYSTLIQPLGDCVDIITNNDDFTSIDIHQAEDLLLAESALKIRRYVE